MIARHREEPNQVRTKLREVSDVRGARREPLQNNMIPLKPGRGHEVHRVGDDVGVVGQVPRQRLTADSRILDIRCGMTCSHRQLPEHPGNTASRLRLGRPNPDREAVAIKQNRAGFFRTRQRIDGEQAAKRNGNDG